MLSAGLEFLEGWGDIETLEELQEMLLVQCALEVTESYVPRRVSSPYYPRTRKLAVQLWRKITHFCIDGHISGPLRPQFKQLWRVLGRDLGPIGRAFDKHSTPVVADDVRRSSAYRPLRRYMQLRAVYWMGARSEGMSCQGKNRACISKRDTSLFYLPCLSVLI